MKKGWGMGGLMMVLLSSVCLLGGVIFPLAKVSTCEEWEKVRKMELELYKKDLAYSIQKWAVDVLDFFSTVFASFERRYPESYEELCASPYVPVPCEELLYPLIEPSGTILWKPFTYFFQKLRPGEMGYTNLQVKHESPPMKSIYGYFAYVPECVNGKLKVVRKEEWDRSWLRSHIIRGGGPTPEGKVEALAYRRDTPVPLRKALVIESFLDMIFDEPILREGNIAENVEKVLQLPLLKKIRNPFTGKVAQRVFSPSPGDFQIVLEEVEWRDIIRQGDPIPPETSVNRIVEVQVTVFGEKGMPVLSELLDYWLEPIPPEEWKW